METSRSTGLYYRVRENSIGIKMSKDGTAIRRFDFALTLQLGYLKGSNAAAHSVDTGIS